MQHATSLLTGCFRLAPTRGAPAVPMQMSRFVLRQAAILCGLFAVALLGLAGAARASTTQESIFQDDRLLMSPDDGLRQRTLGARSWGTCGGLPRIAGGTAWNEPTLGSWLTPQYTGSSKHPVQASPRIYRGLFYAAAEGLAASGHSGDQLLAGETGPIGQTG